MTGATMDTVVNFLRDELAALRTGRANPALVTDVTVDAYGTPTPVKQLAQVSVPDATTLQVTPWDKETLAPLEEALKQAGVGQVSNTGTAVRVTLPPMTEERRVEMTKVVGEKLEAAKVSLRNLRHDAISHAEKEELPEDALKRRKDDITKQASDIQATLEKTAETKKQEIMTV